MLKSIAKNTAIVVAQWTIVAVLAISAITLYNKAFAEEAPIGWVGNGNNPDSEEINTLKVTGDQGGKFALYCINGGAIKFSYKDGNGNYHDQALIRNYGHKAGEIDHSLVASKNSHTTLEVYKFLLNADSAMIVETATTSEAFVTGPIIAGYIKQMVKKCPAEGKTRNSL